ncbi:unnamed protein product [Fusarium graminearum]|nr:unnamed protein product [Fusarium graminearum]
MGEPYTANKSGIFYKEALKSEVQGLATGMKGGIKSQKKELKSRENPHVSFSYHRVDVITANQVSREARSGPTVMEKDNLPQPTPHGSPTFSGFPHGVRVLKASNRVRL